MGDNLIMNRKERLCKTVFDQITLKQLSQKDAVLRLKLSYRQVKRRYNRYLREGDAGLVHKSRGKPSTRAYSQEKRERVIELYQEKYIGYGPTLASEKLMEDDNLNVHAETLRLWLKSEGLWVRQRKYRTHRSRRERRPCFGELLQLDGSIHPWFSDSDEKQCLMNMVDDATSKTLALLDTGETTFAALSLLKWWIELHGIPMAIYVDLKSLYVAPKSLRTDEHGELVDPEWLTHFSRACKHLGIAVIKAHSAQAKGRVERNHAVYQDRFVKELKLKGITTIEGANELLKNGFIDNLNNKFAKPPASDDEAHVPISPDDNLNHLLCWEYNRTMSNDWVVRFDNQYFQLKKEQATLLQPSQQIKVKRLLDGSITLWRDKTQLYYSVIDKAQSKKLKQGDSKPYTSAQRSGNATKNRHKTPWGQYSKGWLTKTNKRNKIAV